MRELFGVTYFFGLEYGSSLLDVANWRERNTRTFEDVEKSTNFLKSLLVETLFGWSHIWGFTQCISISDFVHSISI